MCSAAATLGFTTSQFAMTRVFGTLPSVWQQNQMFVSFSEGKHDDPTTTQILQSFSLSTYNDIKIIQENTQEASTTPSPHIF